MSVVIFSPTEKIWGGSQIFIESLCRFLDARNTTSTIATSEPLSFQCPTVELGPVGRKRDRLLESIRLAFRLSRVSTKVVVLNDLSALWLAPIFKLRGFKVVALLHLRAQRKNALGFGHRPLELMVLKFGARFADVSLSVNSDNLSAFTTPVKFVGNFVPDWFFEPKTRIRKVYDLGFIGRFAPEKNLIAFLHLIKNLSSVSGKPVRAVMAGDGSSAGSIRSTIIEMGLSEQIDLIGWQDREDLPMLYDSIRCFAIMSHHEGFPTTLLEAHARGVPAIASDTAGYASEFLADEGPVTGLRFRWADTNQQAFLRKVARLIKRHADYYEDCVSKARTYSEKRVLGMIASEIDQLTRDNCDRKK